MAPWRSAAAIAARLAAASSSPARWCSRPIVVEPEPEHVVAPAPDPCTRRHAQLDNTIEAYLEALERTPDDFEVQLRVGSMMVIAGQVRRAIPLLERAQAQCPRSPEANHFLGRALLHEGTRLVDAMSYLETAVRLDPNRAEHHLYVGWAANELGLMSRARPALDEAIALDPHLGDAYWQRGSLLQKMGAITEALADLRRALAERPSRVDAWSTIARCHEDLRQWREADDAYRRAIEGNDTIADWHYRLGALRARHGNPDTAVASLERAIALEETGEAKSPPLWLHRAHLLLGEAYQRRHDRAKAIAHYQRTLELAPSDGDGRRRAEAGLSALGVDGG